MNLEIARHALTSNAVEKIIAGVKALGVEGSLSDLQSLIGLVKHPDARVKQEAIEATTTLILNNLLTRFSELEPTLREKLGTIMESLDPAIVEEIGKELYSEDDDRRLRAVQILGLLKKNPTIKTVLAKLVQDRNEKVRATAINLLGRVIGQNDHEILMALLNDSDKRVRANTIEALERLGNKRIVPLLLRYRNDPSNRIRGNVLKALFTLGYTDIEKDLLAMLGGSDNFMKASSLWVISQIKLTSRRLEDSAGSFLLTDDEMVLRNAKKALEAQDTPRAKGFVRYLYQPLPARPTPPQAK